MCKTKIRPQIKPILLASLGSLVALLPVWGQALPPNARRTEPLEKYDNPPPARIFRIETSPRMVSQFGPFTSYQVNVDANGNNILGDAANECSISVDPTNGNKMTIGWRQFNNVTSNFRQGGWGYTTDGGVNWTFPGVLENNVFRSDQCTNSDETGNFFYLSLRRQNIFVTTCGARLNGGQSWTLQLESRRRGGDKQWFTIDKTNGPGHGFQYQLETTALTAAAAACNSNAPPTAGSPGRLRSLFLTQPIYGTLDVDTNGNLFIGGEASGEPVFLRSLEQRADRRPDTNF